MIMRPIGTGYTLVELMIVLAIIAIIAAIAIPTFDSYTKKARIERIKSAVLSVAAAQDRFFAARGRYTNIVSDLANYGFKGTADAQISIGVQITANMGQGYWVAGSADIDKLPAPTSPDTYNECWLFFGRNMPQPKEAQSGFLWLWNDIGNTAAYPVPPFIDKDTVCK